MSTSLTHSLQNQAHESWHPLLKNALAQMDASYLQALENSDDWLPGRKAIFNAFSLPRDQVRYVLLGESPYPRADSANGYAFYDAAVHDLWNKAGLSKPVNRATSLRNFIKMLLVAEGLLPPHDTSQTAIAELPKTKLIATNHELFNRLQAHGFLLLNASLVLQAHHPKTKDAKAWHPFLIYLLKTMQVDHGPITWLLFGRIAMLVQDWIKKTHMHDVIIAEHPYNLSFIQNRAIQNVFAPLHLLLA